MKKLLAMALALALCLGLAAPALAEDGTDAYHDYDYYYNWYGYDEALYDEYKAAHPEEMAALDVDQLLADWQYEDINMTAEEQFMNWQGQEGESLEEAVVRVYVEKRLDVLESVQDAQTYKAEYPEAWADFDADAYFEYEWGWDKGDYYAYFCIFTDEEFVDNMFVNYVNMYGLYDDWDYGYNWDYGYDYDYGEQALVLMVNGVANEAEVTAEGGVSYVDAAVLREILGAEAVPADQTGPVAIRAAAEAAGWDVAWYNGWWDEDQEIQLWDKAAYEARLAEEFGPLNDLLTKNAERGRESMFSQEAVSGHDTVDVKLTAFSTLNGNKDYTMTMTIDYVAQNGVLDGTITFDVAALLQVMDPWTLRWMIADSGFTADQLTQVLKAGKMELILDYNENVMAYNIPFLGLVDEDLAGWQTCDLGLPGGDDGVESTYVSTLYTQMLDRADYLGAEYAAEKYEDSVGLMVLFAGKDRFAVQNGKTTYSLTTQAVNEYLSDKVVADGAPEAAYSFFKAFDMTFTQDDKGNTSLDLHIRPDVDGIKEAAAAQDDYSYYYGMDIFGWSLPSIDMDITASGSGNQNGFSGKLSVHRDNEGTLELNLKETLSKSTKSPRQIKDVAPEIDQPRLGIIGGTDGPTAIFTGL